MSRNLKHCEPEHTFRLLSKKEPELPKNLMRMCFTLGLQQSWDNLSDEMGIGLYDSEVSSLEAKKLLLFYKDLTEIKNQSPVYHCYWKALTVTERFSDIFRCCPVPHCLSRTFNFNLKANKLLCTISGPFTIKFVFLMGLLIWNCLLVIHQTIFIKVWIRQQMWAQLEKSLLLSWPTLCFLAPWVDLTRNHSSSGSTGWSSKRRMATATDGNPSTQLSQNSQGRHFTCPFILGALFLICVPFKLQIYFDFWTDPDFSVSLPLEGKWSEMLSSPFALLLTVWFFYVEFFNYSDWHFMKLSSGVAK